jgi:hypothetical protein
VTDPTAPSRARTSARNAALLFAWAPIVLGSPLLAILAHSFLPTSVSNWLFFWPQMAYPYNTFTAPPPQAGPRLWPGFWILFWLVVAAGFVWRVGLLRPRTVFLLAGVVVLVGTILLQAYISSAGLYFELDGP